MSEVLNLSGMSPLQIQSAINKRYGAGSVIVASRALTVSGVSRLSTGIAALDLAIGGGWPEGRFIELHGQYSSFKSTIALLGIAQHQRKYKDGWGLYIDLERTFEAKHAVRLGVDLSRLYLVNPDSGEQAVNMVNDLVTMDSPLMVVLDSLAALVPSAEINASMDQAQMGVQARLVNRMMRVLTARTKRSMYDMNAPKVTILVLNQIRMKIGVMFGNPETTPGGVGKDFAYSLTIRLGARHSKAIVEAVTRNGIKREIQYAQTVGFKVVKNKCGGPQHEQGEFQFYERDWKHHKAYTFNNADVLFEAGVFWGVIDTASGYSFNSLRAKKEKEFVNLLEQNPKAARMLRREIIEKITDSTLTEKAANE